MSAPQSEPTAKLCSAQGEDQRHSSYREKLIEHVFIAELLQETWYGRGEKIEVLRAEVDDLGCDLVLMAGNVVRPIQLKSSWTTARARSTVISVHLARRSGAMVIWIRFTHDETTNRLRLSYRVLGGGPLDPISTDGLEKARDPHSGRVREDHRVVPESRFDKPCGMEQLLERLFGWPPIGN